MTGEAETIAEGGGCETDEEPYAPCLLRQGKEPVAPVSDDADHEWTPDEIAIAEATANQAAVSVENARLLAETQLRAAREQMVGEVTSQMRASLDMDLVLRTAIRQIAEKLGVAQVEVHLGADLEDEGDTNGR